MEINNKALAEQILEGLDLGDRTIVSLQLDNRFFNLAFIKECLTEIQQLEMAMKVQLVEGPSPLQKLALYLLLDSSSIFIPEKTDA